MPAPPGVDPGAQGKTRPAQGLSVSGRLAPSGGNFSVNALYREGLLERGSLFNPSKYCKKRVLKQRETKGEWRGAGLGRDGRSASPSPAPGHLYARVPLVCGAALVRVINLQM